jgi:hypothetical protein
MKTLLAATLLFATACASDDGTPPAITGLTYSPMTATHGVVVTVTGSFTFDDDDGDLADLHGELTLPDQTKQSLPKADIRALGDMKTGTLGFQLQALPPTVGSYKFQLWVTDDADNESNRLDGTLTAN